MAIKSSDKFLGPGVGIPNTTTSKTAADGICLGPCVCACPVGNNKFVFYLFYLLCV